MDWLSVIIAAWLFILTGLVVRDKFIERRRVNAIMRKLRDEIRAKANPSQRTAFDISDHPTPDEIQVLELNHGTTGIAFDPPSVPPSESEDARFDGTYL